MKKADPTSLLRGKLPEATPAQLKMVEAAAQIRLNPDAAEIAFLARQLVLCTLPHSDPGNVALWSRSSGGLTLVMARTGLDEVTGEPIGYPYGTLPRLLLFWATTEAVRKGSRRLELGHSLAEFMREVGLNPETGGGKRSDAKRLREQMTRLFSASLSFQQRVSRDNAQGVRRALMPVADSSELWWSPKRPDQGTLWGSWVELGERFFEAVTTAPVPLDMRALRALKRSPLALDLYAWCSYRAYAARQKATAQTTSWTDLRQQLGAEYASPKNFNAKLRAALRKILVVCPALCLTVSEAGVTILPTSKPSVLPVANRSLPR